jgi:hypothetical protein
MPSRIPDREVTQAVGRLGTFGSDAVVEAAERWGNLSSAVTAAITNGDPAPLPALKLQEESVRHLIRHELQS